MTTTAPIALAPIGVFHKDDLVQFFNHENVLTTGRITRIQGETARVQISTGKKKDLPLNKLQPVCDASKNRRSKPVFTVAERFAFLDATVTLVAQGHAPSCLILGSGGLGKTHSVKSVLRELNLQPDTNYRLIKGNATARGLYDALNTYNGELLIFDDCDSVLDDKIAKNILKGALDSYDQRVVSWFNGEGLESFIFTGRIVFISNKDREQIDQALRSRCLTVDLTLTVEERLQRMEQILPNFLPEVDMELKTQALGLIREYLYNINNLTLRTLRDVITCASAHKNGWERLALYHMVSAN